MSKVLIRTRYDGLDDEYSAASGIICLEPMTVQSEAQNADLNFLLRELRGVDGIPVMGDSSKCFYGDVSEVGDYQSCLETVIAARDAFMQQPAHIRAKFDNDPGKFIDYCTDPVNADEAIKLGLREAPAAAAAAPVPPAGG